MTVSTETYNADFTNLYFRLPLEAKEVIERAAIVLGQNITDFAIAAILKTAMAADPQIQAELRAIEQEFAAAEADGLERE